MKGFPIFDLAGVEVLRGPQGTLFGRNTPAGVVKFESEKPNTKKVEGYYNASVASHNTINVDGAVNVPLSDKWAMRFSTLRQHRDDYVDHYADTAFTQKTGTLWQNGKYEVAGFGRNITDSRRITGAIDFNNLTGFTNEPRTWGVQFKGTF